MPASKDQVKVVDEMLNRIAGHRGVLGLLVVSPKDGSVWKTCVNGQTPFEEKKLSVHAEKLHAFVTLARSVVRTLDVSNDLIFLRIRSKKHEFIISPEKDFVLIVIQDYHLTTEEQLSTSPSKSPLLEADKKAKATAKDGSESPVTEPA
ncbi:flagellar outer arm dynein-associated protein [Diplonema papillatum]|nr:flagellar outer arm dynein-associated protein [Diplonema papillatum]